jgi:hypothetical protein
MKNSAALLAALATVCCLPRPAEAALTSSEKAVVKTFVQKGVPDTAPRVRALVARPDLSADEVVEPLRQGYADAPFDDAHRRFTEALLFGPGGAAARSTLVPAVVESLLARASSKMDDVPLESSAKVSKREEASVKEILAIHAFVNARIANAGTPSRDGHDPNASIRDDALRVCAELYKKHLVGHERWMRAPGVVSQELSRVRAQAGLTLVDLGRGILGRHELSEALGLEGARRVAFERDGVLIEAPGAADARLADAVRWLEAAPRAADDLSLWVIGKTTTTGLVARGRIARSGVVLSEALRPMAPDVLWPDEVDPSRPDVGLATVAGSVAELATGRALAPGSTLLAVAATASEHAARAGAQGYLAHDVTAIPLAGEGNVPAPAPASNLIIAEAVRLLLIDAPRVIDLALIRAGEGRPEPLEQLTLALTVLAGDATTVTLGRTKENGAVESIDATDVKKEGALVSRFVLAGKRYTFAAGKDGSFVGAVDGAVPKLTSLGGFRPLPRVADTWTAGGNLVFQKLYGQPSAVALDDGRFVVQGTKGGFDAVATGESMFDMTVSAVVRPTGAGGGLVVRGSNGDLSYSGVALFLDADAGRAQLVVVDGRGKATELSAPVPLPPATPEGYPVTLDIVSDKVTGTVGKLKLEGKLGRAVAEGRAAIATRADGRVEVRSFKVQSKDAGKAAPKPSAKPIPRSAVKPVPQAPQ